MQKEADLWENPPISMGFNAVMGLWLGVRGRYGALCGVRCLMFGAVTEASPLCNGLNAVLSVVIFSILTW